MENFLLYIGKSALAAGAFYLVYLALFQNQKQFAFNRIYLPVSLALSFIIPLITFTTVNYVEPVPLESNPLPVIADSFVPAPVEQPQPQFTWEWYHYLFAIYAAGTALFLLRLLLGHGKAWNIIRKSRVQELFNRLVNISKKDIHPFSFFSKIVLSENTLSHPNLEMIVAHESIHVKEKHTLDILFTEILFLLQWFNPFAWLLKDAVKNNLEYKTDHEIAKTTNAQTYQMAMLALADKQGVAPFLTALNGSQLKNRIIMMKKNTKNKYAWLKQLVVLPLLAVLVMGLAEREVRTEFINPDKKIEIFVNGKQISMNHKDLSGINFSESIDAKQIIKALNLKDVKATRLEDSASNSKLYIRTGDYIPENMKLEVFLNGEKIPSTNHGFEKIDLSKPINRAEIIDALKIEDVVINSMHNNIDGFSFYVVTKDYKPGENKEFDKFIPGLKSLDDVQSLHNEVNNNSENIENTKSANEISNKFDFSQLKIVVDGKEIPTGSPELKYLKLEGLFDLATSSEMLSKRNEIIDNIIDALKINQTKIELKQFNGRYPEVSTLYIRTKDYIPGTNREFETRTSKYIPLDDNGITGPQFYAIDGKIVSKDEFKEVGKHGFKSVSILSPTKAKSIYGEVYDGTVFHANTGGTIFFVTDENSITGKITNEYGEPLDGATVNIKGTTTETSTIKREKNVPVKISGNEQVIGNINWINNEKYSSNELTNVLGVKKGDEYSKKLVEARVYGEVANLYLDNGYLFQNITITENQKSDNTVDLEFTVFEGTRWKIGEIEIAGNKSGLTKDALSRIPIRSGDLFSKSKLIQSVEALNEMIDLDSEMVDVEVNPESINSDDEFNTVDLVFKIKNNTEKIKTIQDLVSFIAKETTFPLEARDEANDELHMRFFAYIDNNGRITRVTEKPTGSQEIVSIEEIVIVANRDKSKMKEVDIKNGNLMAAEAIRVIKDLPQIEIPKLHGKIAELRFKFVLQD
jgi:hypothetical protein